MPALPEDWPAMRVAISRFATAATAGPDGNPAGLPPFWRDQNAPAPPLVPGFVSLRLIAPWAGVGREHRELATVIVGVEEQAQATIEYDAEAMLSFQIHTTAGPDAATVLAQRLQAALRDRALARPLRAAGVFITGEILPSKAPQIAGAVWEQREAVDVRIRARVRTIRSNVDFIAAIEQPVPVTLDPDRVTIEVEVGSPPP